MRTGRPRGFDVDTAVDVALDLFIEKGYEGATFGELTQAMGINPPSFYAAFGNKENLFQRALDAYSDRVTASMIRSLAQPTAYESLEKMLRSAADAYTDPSRPPGCLYVQGGLASGDRAQPVRAQLASKRALNKRIVLDRLQRAATEGDTTVPDEPERIARYISTVTNGMAVMAADGASRAELHEAVDTALMALKD